MYYINNKEIKFKIFIEGVEKDIASIKNQYLFYIVLDLLKQTTNSNSLNTFDIVEIK